MKRDPAVEGRFRASIERLHRAQLESLLEAPAARFADAYAALRGVLEDAGSMGSLLVGIEREDGDVAESRRRLVQVAVGCGTAIAHVVGLAFELEGRSRQKSCEGVPEPTGPRRSEAGSLRAVTDLHRLLVAQLRRLFQTMRREEAWRAARPEELWQKLLLDVADLLPAVAALDSRELLGAECKGLDEATADAANQLAMLRSYPRVPTL